MLGSQQFRGCVEAIARLLSIGVAGVVLLMICDACFGANHVVFWWKLQSCCLILALLA